jgi:hypothetical protein
MTIGAKKVRGADWHSRVGLRAEFAGLERHAMSSDETPSGQRIRKAAVDAAPGVFNPPVAE